MFALTSILMSLCIPATAQNDYVDLGLSVKWGTVNMGTTDLRPYGWYWTWEDALDIWPEDGSRLANKAEWNELLDYCTWEWTEQDGKTGYLITSNIEGYKDRSIFLPASGWLQDGNIMRQHSYGSYWSSSMGAHPKGESAYGLNFMSSGVEWHSENPFSEQSVRMVMPLLMREQTDISIDKKELTIRQNTVTRLNVTMEDGKRNVNSTCHWKSSDENVVSVMDDGLIVARKPGECVITVLAYGKGATCTVTVTPYEMEFVDLGLSVLWATCNLGADNPSDYGDYYAWAEIETKDYYNWSSYRYFSTASEFRAYVDKYTTDGSVGFLLKADNLDRLEDMDDVASVLSDGEWHMPTAQDFEELRKNCSWETVTVKGVKGLEIKSNVPGYKDKKIFIPFAGCMIDGQAEGLGQKYYLWSSTAVGNNNSQYFTVWSDTFTRRRGLRRPVVYTYAELSQGDKGRYVGMNVRPVKRLEADKFSSISLPDEHLDLHYGEIRKMVVSMIPSGLEVNNGNIVWSTTNADVAAVTDGFLIAVGTGSCEITARSEGQEVKMTVTITLPRPEPVDLGLSVKWASANLGASDPKETGAYFAWGETSPKAGHYSGKNYKFGEYSNMWTKYNMGADVYIIGHYSEPDYKETLDLEDDAAAVLLGDGWRMPTADELWELRTKCTWKKVMDTTKIGRRDTEIRLKGYIITSNVPGYEGRSIYLPATGFISEYMIGNDLVANKESLNYWTATMGQTLGGGDNRYRGLNIRPVLDQRVTAERKKLEPEPIKPLTHDAKVDLGLSVLWADCNLGADNPWERGARVAWGETTQKTYYSLYNYKHAKVFKDVKKWTYSKYTEDVTIDHNPYIDMKTRLDSEDDAAHVNWGGDWRMPTKEECRELFEKCKWTEATVNGVHGYKITSKVPGYKSNSIFLPYTSVWFFAQFEDDDPSRYDAGYYMTSELEPGFTRNCVVLSFDPVKAGSSSGYDKRDYYDPIIDEDGTIWSNILLSSYSRTVGAFIRPVCPK